MTRTTKQIHVDFTDVVHHAHYNHTITGIQRVQLEVARALMAADRSVHVFSNFCGCYHDLTPLMAEGTAAEMFAALRRLYVRPFAAHPPRLTLRERGPRAYTQAGVLRGRLSGGSRHPRLEFGPHDLVYVGGAFWADRGALPLYERASRAGASIAAFLHDVIPITHPQFTDGGARPFFERLLSLPLHVVANSEFTRREAARLAPPAGFRSLSCAPLAHEFPAARRNQPAPTAPTRRLERWAQGEPFALCVGTIEIRKNHRALLDLWVELRRAYGKRLPRLIVAGRPGWLAEPALRALRGADAESPFALIDGPSDAELAWLYATSDFTVFASLAEGWGLPVGESLWFGKPCVASNAASVPEVGGDLCLYADPLDIAAFAPPILQLAQDRALRAATAAKIEASPLRTWSRAASEIAERILAIADRASI